LGRALARRSLARRRSPVRRALVRLLQRRLMPTKRFAPSPTGDLHLGGAWTALASWAYARAHGGRCVLRVEDIDTPRVVRGSAERILEDLAWLGFDFDGATIVQSTRIGAYE